MGRSTTVVLNPRLSLPCPIPSHLACTLVSGPMRGRESLLPEKVTRRTPGLRGGKEATGGAPAFPSNPISVRSRRLRSFFLLLLCVCLHARRVSLNLQTDHSTQRNSFYFLTDLNAHPARLTSPRSLSPSLSLAVWHLHKSVAWGLNLSTRTRRRHSSMANDANV